MSQDDLPRVHEPGPEMPDVPTVPRGGGAPITGDELQHDNDTPEGKLRVGHTDTARAVEHGMSPYAPDGGLAPDRPDRATLDNSPDNVDDNGDVVDNRL